LGALMLNDINQINLQLYDRYLVHTFMSLA